MSAGRVERSAGMQPSAGWAWEVRATSAPFITTSEQDNLVEKSTREAEEYRNLGNQAFKANNYEEACRLYTSGLQILYTHPMLKREKALLLSNRAAALLSLGQPLQALSDCKMGLEVRQRAARVGILRSSRCMASMLNHLGPNGLELIYFSFAANPFSHF